MDKPKQCAFCKKNDVTKMCPSCADATYCDGCFSNLHAHGARRRHNYKRIVTEKYDFDAEMKKIQKDFEKTQAE